MGVVREAALRCHGRRSVIRGTKSVLMDFDERYTPCIICRKRPSVPAPFTVLYGSPVCSRDNKLWRTGGESLLPLSPTACVSGARSSRVTPVYGLEQWPRNTYSREQGCVALSYPTKFRKDVCRLCCLYTIACIWGKSEASLPVRAASEACPRVHEMDALFHSRLGQLG